MHRRNLGCHLEETHFIRSDQAIFPQHSLSLLVTGNAFERNSILILLAGRLHIDC